ncbi:MAG: polyprenyl diphosphate synthase [Sphaerochaetaceae bacterium]
MSDLEANLEHSQLPRHIGIIMDGNGRWATQRGLPRKAGHFEGVKAAKRVITEAANLKIPYVTYYVFSTENWKRPNDEITYLMNLMATRIYSEFDLYQRLQSRILVRGDISLLDQKSKDAIEATQQFTKDFNKITVSLAINYGGRDEIVRSVNRFLQNSNGKKISEEDISKNLDLNFIPPVDLIIRSGGDKRISNFLLWDAAYAELAFYESLWPEWNKEHLHTALNDYLKRQRKFGGIV